MALIIPLLSILFGFNYPIKDALLFSVLVATGGIIFMYLGFILSLFIGRETVIIPLGMALMSAIFFITKLPALEDVNIFNFMVGAGYLSNDNFLFNQPINSTVILVITLALILISISLNMVFKKIDI
jgi:hypothetical protein